MRLYYFTTLEHGLAALQDSRRKLARIKNLNDPFEFEGAILDGGARRYARKFKEMWHQMSGLVCLSENWDEPLMWPHYARSHSGICLEFDVERAGLTRVEYVPQRIDGQEAGMIDPAEIPAGAGLGQFARSYQRLMSVKHSCWSYETEWRLFCDLAGKEDLVSQLYFEPFEPAMALREVLVGANSTLKPDRLWRLWPDTILSKFER